MTPAEVAAMTVDQYDAFDRYMRDAIKEANRAVRSRRRG